MEDIKNTLEQRRKLYGGYANHKKSVVAVVDILYASNALNNDSEAITREQSVDVFYLVTKLIRWATNPSHRDSIRDIEGYANLIGKQMDEAPKPEDKIKTESPQPSQHPNYKESVAESKYIYIEDILRNLSTGIIKEDVLAVADKLNIKYDNTHMFTSDSAVSISRYIMQNDITTKNPTLGQ